MTIRPYEKLELYGEKSLTNTELLSIILRTGTKEIPVTKVAESMITKDNIKNLQDISLNDLKRIKGIGRVKAIQIKAICEIAKRMTEPSIKDSIKINSSSEAANLIMTEMRYEKREIVKVIILNTKNILKKIVDVSVGSTSFAFIEPKDIMAEVIRVGEIKFIIAHNHPSGDPTPSENDFDVTRKVDNVAKILGLEFLDHLVIGDGTYTSIFKILKKQ